MLTELVQDDNSYRLPVVLREGEDGYIVATCPLLPGTTTQGRTRDEALENVREAAILALASAAEEGWSPPRSFSIERVEVPA